MIKRTEAILSLHHRGTHDTERVTTNLYHLRFDLLNEGIGNERSGDRSLSREATVAFFSGTGIIAVDS